MHDIFSLLIRQHHALMRKYMSSIDAQPERFWILALLEKGPKSQREICDAVWTKPSTVSIVVTRMVKAGLVKKTVSPDSSRTNCITITPQGLKMLEQMRKVFIEVAEISFKNIPQEEISTMLSVIEKVTKNLQDNVAQS
jgi:DNA-binding MarR family transcriptional regulator